jgi:hypothetical protein
MVDIPATRDPEQRPRFGESAANALRYWEPRRLVYNLALAAVVTIHFVAAWPASRAWLTRDALFGLFFLAVLANVAYCAAYAVDLFIQFSELRTVWPRRRWIVLLTGTAFAAVITHFITQSVLSARGPG